MNAEYRDFALRLLELATPILQTNYELLVKEAGNIDNLLIWKADKKNELVTNGEIAAEKIMRELVNATYPTHDIAGEELGYNIEKSDFLWVFDPIDGTAAMVESSINSAKKIVPEVTNKPYFGITIGLLYKNEAILGVVYDLLNQTTWISGDQMVESSFEYVTELCQAILCCTAPNIMFSTADQQKKFKSVCFQTKCVYINRNCIGFMQLLTGEVDAVWERDLAFHDIAALIPILISAGFYITDECGNQINFFDKNYLKEYCVVAANPELHAKIIASINDSVICDVQLNLSDNNLYYNKKF